MKPKWVEFKPGQIVVTESVAERMQDDERFNRFVYRCLCLFASKNWGDISQEDAAFNDRAVKDEEGRLIGSYPNPMGDDGEHIWIITEYDRSVTTVMFPWEY